MVEWWLHNFFGLHQPCLMPAHSIIPDCISIPKYHQRMHVEARAVRWPQVTVENNKPCTVYVFNWAVHISICRWNVVQYYNSFLFALISSYKYLVNVSQANTVNWFYANFKSENVIENAEKETSCSLWMQTSFHYFSSNFRWWNAKKRVPNSNTSYHTVSKVAQA